jgi:hypothetical protein
MSTPCFISTNPSIKAVSAQLTITVDKSQGCFICTKYMYPPGKLRVLYLHVLYTIYAAEEGQTFKGIKRQNTCKSFLNIFQNWLRSSLRTMRTTNRECNGLDLINAGKRFTQSHIYIQVSYCTFTDGVWWLYFFNKKFAYFLICTRVKYDNSNRK